MIESGREIRIDREATVLFAELSGDWNPLHLDPVRARRSVFGECVAHGAHLLLRALEASRNTGSEAPVELVEVRVRFMRPALHGRTLRLECDRQGPVCELTVRDEDGAGLMAASLVEAPRAEGEPKPFDGAPPEGLPKSMAPEDAKEFACELPLALDRPLLNRLCPGLVSGFSSVQVAELLSATRCVGMECPGLYSTFTSLDLRKHPPGSTPAPAAHFRATSVHVPTGRVRIAMHGPTLAGTLEAFFRPREVGQPSFRDVLAAAGGDDLEGRRVLVVGGSRGLGELAAKVCAARGARVVITFSRGQDDARAVSEEIAQAGGDCTVARLDVGDEASEWLLPQGPPVTDLLYFATPHIGVGGGGWNADRFQGFCRVYIDGLLSVVDFLAAQGSEDLRVFFPSTEFIDRGDGPVEYVAAKLAGEGVARWIGSWPGVRCRVVRLPPLATDQTVTFRGRPGGSAVRILNEALWNVERPS